MTVVYTILLEIDESNVTQMRNFNNFIQNLKVNKHAHTPKFVDMFGYNLANKLIEAEKELSTLRPEEDSILDLNESIGM